MKNKKIFVILVSILIFILNMFGRKVSIVTEYTNCENDSPYGLTTLYFDNGNGFEEDDSVYEEISDMTVKYSFYPSGLIKGIRIIPMREGPEEVCLDKISLYIDDRFIKSITGEELYSSINQEESTAIVEYKNGFTSIKYKEGNPWPEIKLKSSFYLFTNAFSLKTCIRTILYLFIIFIPYIIIKVKKKIKYLIDYPRIFFSQNMLIFLVDFLILWFTQRWLNIYWISILWLFPYIFYHEESQILTVFHRWMNIVVFISTTIIMVFSYNTIQTLWMEEIYRWSLDYIVLIGCSWINTNTIYNLLNSNSKDERNNLPKYSSNIFIDVLVVVIIMLSCYEIMKLCLITSTHENIIFDLLNRMTTPVYLMNIFWGVLFVTVLCGICGTGIGMSIFIMISIIAIFGNAIKIYYHNTMLTPIDFLQIEEMFKMADTVVGKNIICLGIFVLLILGVVLYITRKKWYSIFKPNIKLIYVIIPGIICTNLTFNIISFKYQDRNIFYKGYENEFINERDDGVFFYNIINISKIGEIIMDEPDNYSQEYIEEKIEEFRSCLKTNESKTNPNVILIMAESLFDIESINGLVFNTEIESTLHKFKSGTLISPRYGGYTSAVEYEALTGLSLAFYPPALVPYTTYFNQIDKKIPSIAYEFKKNGYDTYAIHPNDKTFYNRDIAYKMLGFDQFLDKTAFDYNTNNTVAKTFLKDMPIAEKITDLIAQENQPLFIFATTIAGHYMKEDRYSYTDISASHSLLNETELHEIEQTATAYQETDAMFKYLVNFIKESNEPTLLYIFGDHLPPLTIWSKLNYASDFYEKYGTVLSSYSNYSEIIMPEYITPNQLAAQIMKDSEIKHSSYYDYIYSLRDKYPIIHSDILDAKQLPDLEEYRMIQYDIMFGKQWFYEE